MLSYVGLRLGIIAGTMLATWYGTSITNVQACYNRCGAEAAPNTSACIAAAYDEAQLACYEEQAERCDWSEYREYTAR